MTDQPSESITARGEDDQNSLREKAHERNEAMPAESALGHRDPQGGGQGEPADFEGDQN